MLLSESSELVIQHLPTWQTTPVLIDLIFLKGGPVLAISPTSFSLYKNEKSIQDPLSNGLISSANWNSSQEILPCADTNALVKSYKAGVIHLTNDKTILITPVAIQLFSSAGDALHNRDAIAHLNIN